MSSPSFTGGGGAVATVPTPTMQWTPVYTGNNVFIRANGALIGLVQTLTISRAAGRHYVYQVGGPIAIDAPVGQVSVQVSLTNVYPVNGSLSLRALGVSPSGSMANQVNAAPYNLSVHDNTSASAPALWTILNSFYQQDSLQVPQTTQLTYTLSLLAFDAIDNH